MALAVRFRPEAEAEAIDIRDWYERRRTGLGKEFTAALADILQRIAERPLLFRRAHNEIRRAVLARFPYAVYFRVHGSEIIVLAVHGRQDPARWQSR